jgi:hypothetical protein
MPEFTKEQREALGLPPISVIIEGGEEEEEKTGPELLKDAFISSTQQTVLSYGTTREAKLAQKVDRLIEEGKTEEAAEIIKKIHELRGRMIKHEDAIKERGSYEGKYSDEGAFFGPEGRVKNLADPKWWAQFAGELIPGSLPFLGSAYGAARLTAMAPVPGARNPFVLIAAAMIGGGSAVYAQAYGNAYFSYLQKHPGEKEGAQAYAVKKSKLTGIINAATIPLGLAGYSKPVVERMFIQALLQANAGVYDTYKENQLEKEYIDPDIDLTRGFMKSAMGEAVFEGLTTGKIARSTVSTALEDRQRKKEQEEYLEAVEKDLDLQAETELEEVWEDYFNVGEGEATTPSVSDVREIVNIQPIFSGIEIYANDTRESANNKLKERLRHNILDKKVEDEATLSTLSETTRPQVLEQEEATLKQMPRAELFDQIVEAFSQIDQNGELDMDKTWEAYNFWADRVGGYTPSRWDKFLDEETDISEDIFALANARANNIMNEMETGSILSMGKIEFEDFVRKLSEQKSREELEQIALKHVPGTTENDVRKKTKEDLAFDIAEAMSVLERFQKQDAFSYKDAGFFSEPGFLGYRKKLAKLFPDVLSEVGRGEMTQLELSAEQAENLPANIQREIGEQGNALYADGQIQLEEEGSILQLSFVRSGLEQNRNYTDTLLQENGFNREPTYDTETLGQLVVSTKGDHKGKTLNYLLATEEGFRLKAIQLPKNRMPQNQTDFFNKRIIGPYTRQMRPAGRVGNRAFKIIKEKEGRVRALEFNASRLAFRVNAAIAAATRKEKGKTPLKDYDVRLLLGSFIKKTNIHRDLTQAEKEGRQAEIKALVKNLETVESETERKDIEERILGHEIDIQGPVSVAAAIRELPTKALQDVARYARKSIDALSKRVLNESIGKELEEEQINVIQDSLGSYTTNVFKIFETAMGFNPKFDKSIWGKMLSPKRAKMAQQLFEEAVVSLIYFNVNKADYQKNPRATAIRDLNTLLIQASGITKSDIANMSGIAKETNRAKAVNLEQGPQLMTRKKELPFAVRRLLGEVTAAEPDILVATTYSRVSRLVEQGRMFDKLMESNYEPGEMFLSPMPNEVFRFKIPADPFNPMGEMFTTLDVAQTLGTDPMSDANDMKFLIDLYRGLVLYPKGFTQYGMIVLSPGTQMRNFYGGAFMVMHTGNLLTGKWSESTQMIFSELFPDLDLAPDGSLLGSGEKAQKINALGREIGIINTEVATQDALGVFKTVSSGGFSSAQEVVSALYSIKHTVPGKIIDNSVGATIRALGNTYGATDNFFKMFDWGANIINIKNALDATFDKPGIAPVPDYVKVKFLHEFSKTLTMNAGTYKSSAAELYKNETHLDTYIYKLAGYMTRNTMHNYDYVGRFAEVIRQFPMGNFIAFPTETVRVVGNNTQLMYKLASYRMPSEIALEAGVPENVPTIIRNEDGSYGPKLMPNRPFRNMFIKRMVGAVMAIGGMSASMKVFFQMMFNVTDEELEALDEGVPEYERYALKLPMSEIRKDGTGMDYWNTSFTLPFEDFTTVFRTISKVTKDNREVGAELPESVLKGVWTGFANYTKSFYGISIAPEVMLELVQNRNTSTGNAIYVESDDLGEKLVASLEHVLQSAGPGGYRQIRKVINAYAKGDARFDRYGNVQSSTGAWAGIGGITIADSNPIKDFPFLISSLKTQFDEGVKANMNPLAYQKDEKTAEDVLKQWEDSQQAWFDYQQAFYFRYMAFKEYGKKPFERDAAKRMEKVIGQLQGIDGKKFRRNIERGIFTPWKLPPRFKENYLGAKRELRLEREWPTKELNDRYRALLPKGREGVSLTASPELPLLWEED